MINLLHGNDEFSSNEFLKGIVEQKNICQITLSNIPTGRGSWDLNRKWIIERQKKYNLNISNEGINKLIELLGSNYRYIDNELQKLSNYKPEGNIIIDDIEIMVSGIKEDSIFELIDAIMVKDNLKASKILENLIEQGNSFFNIII